MTSASLTREALKALAGEESLELFGVIELAEDLESFSHLTDWLKSEKQAGMSYMGNHQHLRRDPRLMLEGAQSAIIMGYNYYGGDKLSDLRSDLPRIAQYARLKDYHKFLRKKSERMICKLQESDKTLQARICVDSAPILEKSLAARSLLGFIGKNSLYIHPKLGSYFSLVVILVTAKLDYDLKEKVNPTVRTDLGGCGSCRRCQVNCPTGALDESYSLDSRLCLSYYTIEHRGPVPLKFWPHFKTYLFGCDLCQIVCPYNRGSSLTERTFQKLGPHVDLYSVATMDQSFYENTFGGTPMVRAKKEGLQRNALIAMVVTRSTRLDQAIEHIKTKDPKPVLLETIEQASHYQF